MEQKIQPNIVAVDTLLYGVYSACSEGSIDADAAKLFVRLIESAQAEDSLALDSGIRAIGQAKLQMDDCTHHIEIRLDYKDVAGVSKDELFSRLLQEVLKSDARLERQLREKDGERE